jgi:hypothetical protein
VDSAPNGLESPFSVRKRAREPEITFGRCYSQPDLMVLGEGAEIACGESVKPIYNLLMLTPKHVSCLVLTLAAIPLRSDAATLSESAVAPAISLISQPDFSAGAFNGSQDFSDNAGPPGQTFLTGPVAFTLEAITVKGFANTGASFGNLTAATWTISISSVSGTVLTRVDQETTGVFVPVNGANYLTFTFDTPVTLNANSSYAYDIFSSAGYFGFAKSTTDVYAGGFAMQHGTTARLAADGATIANQQTVDRTFYVQGTAVPEPSSCFLGLSGAVYLLGIRRKR